MAKFSVRKPLTVIVAVLAILILGVVAFNKMTPDLLPNMDFPYVVIVTSYPGASPETVEAEVTKPLEQAMATLEHIKNITSNSRENLSIVMLEFEDAVNMDTIGVDIQQNLTSLSGTWSDSVSMPYMIKINPSLLPVEIAAVSMSGMDTIELSDFVDDTLLPQLEGVSGVARISTVGSVSRQVRVVIDQDLIDDVNARIADAVNRQMDDAAAELEETKAELTAAQEELEEAQEQLSSGRSALIDQTSSAESAINQQQIALLEGRMELQSQLVSLAQSRSQLETTLGIVRPILETLQDLEQRRDSIQGHLDALVENSALLSEARDGLAAFEEQLEELQASLEPDGEDAPDPQELIRQITESEEYLAALDALAAVEAALEELGSSQYSLPADIAAAEAELAAIAAELSSLEVSLGALDLSRDGLEEKVAEMESGIERIDEASAALSGALSQLDSGAIQLSDALGTLSSAKSDGLLELADAAAQIAMNAGTVDSALAQVDAGLDSIEDSRSDALASSEISDTISIAAISSILTAQNFSMPAGTVQRDGDAYMVSLGDELTDPEELKSLLLFNTGENVIGPVYLSDVARISVTDNADDTYARLDGENGLILVFEKQSNTPTASVTDSIAARFGELEAKYDGLHFVSLMDQGSYIYIIIRSILQSLTLGAVFAVVVLLLFLRDIRPTIITVVSIPVSVIFAFVLMYFSGVTLNMISLSGLAVSVGMLVDNSIVVIENIYRLRARGASAIQAAVAGTGQVAGAITASTLTTICVFLPIVFVEGITRQLFTDLALTMGYALAASLIIALTLVPAMARGMLGGPEKAGRSDAERGESRFYRGYRRMIGWSLRHKWLVLPFAVILLAGSAFFSVRKGFSYFPDVDMNTVSVSIRMPEDAGREEAAALADQVLERIGEMESVETVGAMMGGMSLVASSRESYDVTAYVTLPEGESGAAAGEEIIRRCADLPVGISYDSQMVSTSALTGSGIGINVFGNDMEQLQEAARSIADTLAAVPGVRYADPGLQDAQTALHITVDRNAAMEKGYTVTQLYMSVASALTSSASSIRMEMGDITANVIVSAGAAMTADELMALSFDYTDGDGKAASFTLGDVAALDNTVSLSSIRRDGQRRCVNVTAGVDDDHNVTLVSAEARDALAALELPGGVTYEFDGENEEIMDSVRQLIYMLLLGVVLVYFIMVAQFQSLKSPFIVMFTIPLAFTGGFLALLICRLDVSILSLIGFVMLTGIIVNNGIVLVDCVNQLRAEGMERREALTEAGVMRLRPILMTSLTTVLGLIVMALGRNAGTAMMQPVAIVCIGGLLYATLMTLIVVPCIYDMANRKEITVVRDEDTVFSEEPSNDTGGVNA